MRVLLFVLTFIFGLSIGYSRLFLGMHTLNQIIFGLLLGVWIALSWHYATHPWFADHSRALLDGSYFSQNRDSIFGKTSCITLIAFLILMAVQIANYIIVFPQIKIDPIWSI
jgi:hypothetical protein